MAIVEDIDDYGNIIITSGSYFTSDKKFTGETVAMHYGNEVAVRTFHFG